MNVGGENKSGLKLSSCTDKFSFICEAIETTCAVDTTTTKNRSLFNLEGKLIDSSSYGSWANTLFATFLFGRELVTWKESWTKCASLGMSPMILNGSAEYESFIQTIIKRTSNSKTVSARIVPY
ncbi:uncharacterized protein LOC132205214 [Neocloeon triangulifer]|uniref:uncharacterized protein LOC132205214 n=1 Tax=Neocloeon triangulifer TaxID=2078957 RepID=UPI00286F15B3|nr:uncharacterized protein LOC132205214 [Neocloeon triangulifer]